MQKINEKRFKSIKEMRLNLKTGDIVKYRNEYASHFFLGIIRKIESDSMHLFVFKSTIIHWSGFQKYTMEFDRYTKMEFGND